MFRNVQRRPVETFLVGSADSALTNVANPGEHINLNTGAANIANGQLGLMCTSPIGTVGINVLTDATPTIAEAPVVKLVQGNANSANPSAAVATYPLAVRAFESSQDIDSAYTLTVTKQLAVTPTHSTWVIGGDPGGTDVVTALDNTTYELTVVFKGRVMDEFYSPNAAHYFTPEFTTPNYTALGTAQPVDHLIQNLCYNINRNSYALGVPSSIYRGGLPIVAIAIDETSGAGGVDADAITAGTVLDIVTTNLGTRSITLTQAMVDSIQDALSAAGWAADTALLTIDLSTAGTATGGIADGFILMALDRPLAYVDYIPQVKTRLDVGLSSGFDSTLVYHNEEVFANEGQGQGRVLDLFYKATHGQRKYSLRHTLDPVINYPSPVDVDEEYVQYTIHHINSVQIDSFNIINSPMKEIVLIPSANSTAIASFDTIFGAWVTSANGVGIVTI